MEGLLEKYEDLDVTVLSNWDICIFTAKAHGADYGISSFSFTFCI
jgi:hypothetical protein